MSSLESLWILSDSSQPVRVVVDETAPGIWRTSCTGGFALDLFSRHEAIEMNNDEGADK